MTWMLHLVARLFWRFRGYNTAVLDAPGPVLLIPQHVSWLDWLFVGVCLKGDWKFVVSEAVSRKSWVHRKIMVNRRTFPIDPNSPYAVKHMAEFLQQGGRLVLFAEGRLSRTGSLMKLFDGTGFLIFKTRAKVITCYLRGANRDKLATHRGWKVWFPQVTAHFSEVLTAPHPGEVSTKVARATLTRWLRDQMVDQQFRVEMEFGPKDLVAALTETARRRPGFRVLEDANLEPVSFRRMFVGAGLLARQLRGGLLPGEGDACRIGVLLPNVNAMPVLLLALWKLERVPAVLNFTTGTKVMLQCVELAGLREVITSRVFLERARLDLQPLLDANIRLIYLEDIRVGIGAGAKLASLVRHTLLGIPQAATVIEPTTTAVILFTSGSEGVPKGVELTHQNILANIRQAIAITDLEDNDRLFNCLPLFHSFGLVVGTLLPLVRGFYVFLYPSPLHYRIVPNAVYDRDCTVFLSTNTFLNGYARKAHPYDFRRVRYLFAAAEKLQNATAQLWAQRFGVPILEGYGATECSPALSLNTPMAPCYGSAGRFLPGIEWKLEPVEGVSEKTATEGINPPANQGETVIATANPTPHGPSDRPVSPHPGPLPKEREELWPGGSSKCVSEADGRSMSLPLPGGEGRGEGKRDDHSKEKPQPGSSSSTIAITNAAKGAPRITTGRLFVRGPNVMKGYLNVDANAAFQKLGGWYDTGDIVQVDQEGFVHIRGRMKRFAKVSGEMVSLTAVEDALAGAFPHYGLRCAVAVVSRPCEQKGEMLIAVTNEPKLQMDEIRAAIRAKGLSNLCIPKSIQAVREIPKLGTGKVNHRELVKMMENEN